MSPKGAKVLKGALDDIGDSIVLRGVLDSASLGFLNADNYQREILSAIKVAKIQAALERGKTVPDIEVGCRGFNYTMDEEEEGVFYLPDPLYIIDGLQRTTAARRCVEAGTGVLPQLGIKVHFGTDEPFERELFEEINEGQSKLSGNIILRNRAKKMPVMDALLRLTANRNFVLRDKVTWSQNMRRNDLITGTTYAKTVAMLHSHAGPGRGSKTVEIAEGLAKIMDTIKQGVLISNTKMFFDEIDQCWNIKDVVFREGAAYLKSTFLLELARVISDHENFWNGDRLVFTAALHKQLAAFPVNDPFVLSLASGSGSSGQLLYQKLVDHMNAKKRTNRLKPRRSLYDAPATELGQSNEVEQNCDDEHEAA